MNFDELPEHVREMLRKMHPGVQHIEVMSAEDMDKLRSSVEVIADKLPRLCFANAATALFYTGFTPTVPSIMMKSEADVHSNFIRPKWTYNSFKVIKWHPDHIPNKLSKGDRICICLHHLRGLTVLGYYIAALKRDEGLVVMRSEIAGGVSYLYREHTTKDDELDIHDLFALPNPFKTEAPPVVKEANIFEGLEDFEAYENWEAPADPDYFKG